MPKRLIVCCDGTWNKPDQPSPTNVTKLALYMASQDPAGIEQRVFYDKGVGTGRFDHLLGGAFGVGLSKNVQDGYRFLVANYEPGDELFFFGFSRGAYTARSIVGFIRNSGLLKREYADKLAPAYDLYRRRDDASHPDAAEAELFRKSFAYEPRVKFIGVWDTVGALGIPLSGPLGFFNKKCQFHDVRLSRAVDHAYHALAIDEKRKPFRPALWEQHPAAKAQVLEQVWFAGVHSNVGGGYPDSGLSNVALLWMVGKAQDCGLAFDRARLNAMVKPDPLGKLENSQNFFFKLLGGDFVRAIGEKSCEFAGSTAKDRMDDAPSNYRPENLCEYLAGGGAVTRVLSLIFAIILIVLRCTPCPAPR